MEIDKQYYKQSQVIKLLVYGSLIFLHVKIFVYLYSSACDRHFNICSFWFAIHKDYRPMYTHNSGLQWVVDNNRSVATSRISTSVIRQLDPAEFSPMDAVIMIYIEWVICLCYIRLHYITPQNQKIVLLKIRLFTYFHARASRRELIYMLLFTIIRPWTLYYILYKQWTLFDVDIEL